MKIIIVLISVLQFAFCEISDIGSSVNQINKRNDLIEILIEQGLIDQVDNIDIPKESLSFNQDDVTLSIYTKAEPSGTAVNLADANNITTASPFNPELKTVIFVHGWLNKINYESCALIKDTLLKVTNVNIILVNWDKCAVNIIYFASKWCIPFVGQYVGEFLMNMTKSNNYSLSDITIVGHSLGAHVAGCIGKNTGGALGTIVGLDPAGPFFFSFDSEDQKLTKNDAQYVQALHTNALFCGVNYQVGHADFWPNGGYVQDGCGLDPRCSHTKAYRYYAESLENNQFVARECENYDDYKNGKCNQNAKALFGGISINTTVFGNYFLEANADPPYGKGDI